MRLPKRAPRSFPDLAKLRIVHRETPTRLAARPTDTAIGRSEIVAFIAFTSALSCHSTSLQVFTHGPEIAANQVTLTGVASNSLLSMQLRATTPVAVTSVPPALASHAGGPELATQPPSQHVPSSQEGRSHPPVPQAPLAFCPRAKRPREVGSKGGRGMGAADGPPTFLAYEGAVRLARFAPPEGNSIYLYQQMS
jgi:hypothetical protein